MSWPRDVDHVQIILIDDPVQVRVDEVLSRGCSPVTQQHALHIGCCQRSLQERIVVKIYLPDRQIVGGPPVSVQIMQKLGGKRVYFHFL